MDRSQMGKRDQKSLIDHNSERRPKMERAYDPMTERTSDQTNDTLSKYVSEHLNEHNIPLPPDQVYLIAEALAQGAYEAMRTLIERLS